MSALRQASRYCLVGVATALVSCGRHEPGRVTLEYVNTSDTEAFFILENQSGIAFKILGARSPVAGIDVHRAEYAMSCRKGNDSQEEPEGFADPPGLFRYRGRGAGALDDSYPFNSAIQRWPLSTQVISDRRPGSWCQIKGIRAVVQLVNYCARQIPQYYQPTTRFSRVKSSTGRRGCGSDVIGLAGGLTRRETHWNFLDASIRRTASRCRRIARGDRTTPRLSRLREDCVESDGAPRRFSLGCVKVIVT